MKLWMKYVKQRRRGILAGGLFVVIFVISFVLYRLPVKAVCYPAALCFFLAILFIILDFRRVKRRHELLTGMRELTDILTETLPAVDGVEDEDCMTYFLCLYNFPSQFTRKNLRLYIIFVKVAECILMSLKSNALFCKHRTDSMKDTIICTVIGCSILPRLKC